MVQENVATVQADVTSVMETEFCGIDSSLTLTLGSKLAVVSNSTTTMGSPKSQPITNESSLFIASLILVVEVKSDTWVAKISDIDAALPTHDSSPIIAPINSNSQQSQRQVFNMVKIPDKEKSATTEMKGNEPDQSNQPPHRAIWKPLPWPILKVNSDDAIFWEQNSVGVVLDMEGGLVLFWRSTIDVIVEGSGTNYINTVFQEKDRAGIGVIIRDCQGKGLAHMVGITPLPLTVIELETLAISTAL
ncbi:hypothetical protein CMV_014576 [Castanea mollissima]|uniref:Uncharacterized protein n=1 Tax=Castanea mollissima TaxID=60419 RepID=A0A8J4VUA7_9ROSI|nr:hypothetical protein CMV_014576 [Castanea mollissima]